MPILKPVQQMNTLAPRQADTIFNQQKRRQKQEPAYHVLWQDKHRGETASPASVQPAPHGGLPRSHEPNSSFARSQNGYAGRRKTVPLTLWVQPIEKEQLQRIADAEKISLPQAGRAFIRQGMQARADLQYSSILEPIIERSIARYLGNRDSRIISLLVRIAFDSGQTRSIVTNILGLQPDISPELLRDIIAESDKRTKSNIMRRTPQITELIEALEKWFFETRREGKESQPH